MTTRFKYKYIKLQLFILRNQAILYFVYIFFLSLIVNSLNILQCNSPELISEIYQSNQSIIIDVLPNAKLYANHIVQDCFSAIAAKSATQNLTMKETIRLVYDILKTHRNISEWFPDNQNKDITDHTLLMLAAITTKIPISDPNFNIMITIQMAYRILTEYPLMEHNSHLTDLTLLSVRYRDISNDTLDLRFNLNYKRLILKFPE